MIYVRPRQYGINHVEISYNDREAALAHHAKEPNRSPPRLSPGPLAVALRARHDPDSIQSRRPVFAYLSRSPRCLTTAAISSKPGVPVP